MRTLALLLLSGALAAQSASFTPFGTGCAFQSQSLTIGNQGLPVLGSSFQITYSGPNFTFSSGQQIARPYLVLGFGTQVTPLPVTLLPQQPAGCTGFITPDVLLETPVHATLPEYENFVTIQVPNVASLVGYQFHAQWLALVQQCGFAGCGLSAIPTSDAATVLVGF
jgi:hypothetical protein